MVAFGLEYRDIRLRFMLDSLFHSFVALPWGVLIFPEIGLLGLGNLGQKLCDYDAAVIEDFEIIGYKENMTFMESSRVSLSLPIKGVSTLFFFCVSSGLLTLF